MKAKTKKVLTGTAAIVLTAAISIGGTFAYLTRLTEKRANNFTFASKGLNATLTEPEWDGIVDYEYDEDDDYVRPVYEEDEDIYGYYTYEDSTGKKIKKPLKIKPTDLNSKTPVDKDPDEWDINETEYPGLKEWIKKTREKKGQDTLDYDDYERPDEVTVTESDGSKKKKRAGYLEAQDMIPGKSAKKNPLITNTGDLDEWVAAKVSFVYSTTTSDHTAGEAIADISAITDVIEISWDTTNWTYAGDSTLSATAYSNGMVFYYNELLEVNGDIATAPLFTTVTVSEDATNEQIKALEALGGFTIYIEGYAIQGDAFEDTADWLENGEATFTSDGKTGSINLANNNLGIAPAESPTELAGD